LEVWCKTYSCWITAKPGSLFILGFRIILQRQSLFRLCLCTHLHCRQEGCKLQDSALSELHFGWRNLQEFHQCKLLRPR
jgi:hypothetical protein